MGSSVFELIEW